MSQLFEELTINILSRLPVRSLLRFRCVSKLWCNWIDGQEFVNKHIQQSANTNTNLHLILYMWNHFKDLDVYSVHFDDNEVINRSVARLNSPRTSMYGYKIVGSCNGLICISDLIDLLIILWNPFTRRYKELPTALADDSFYNYVKTMYKYRKKKMYHYGFGYDHVNNDYKVVIIIQCLDTVAYEFNSSVIENLVAVYSLRLNSWKTIQDFAYGEYVFDPDRGSCFVSDASHWFVYPGWDKRKSPGEWLIVAFNHKTEEFSTVSHPNRWGRVLQLQNLGGLLCISELERDDCVGIWVMKDYGVRESWIKLHSVILGIRPLAYTKNYGEKLVVQTDRKQLTWHNLKEGTSNRIAFQGSHGGKFVAYTCLESLVSLCDSESCLLESN